MADRPIIFSAHMVRALLGGRKTQDRMVLQRQPDIPNKAPVHVIHDIGTSTFDLHRSPRFINDKFVGSERMHIVDCKIAIGDRLWVREACAAIQAHDGIDCIRYDADRVWRLIENTPEAAERWRDLYYYRNALRVRSSVPSIHMPRWASRLTLVVTDVRVQRLHDISEADAVAEGALLPWTGTVGTACDDTRTARSEFEALWNILNAARGYPWNANPWVCALTFEVHHCNIDQMEAANG